MLSVKGVGAKRAGVLADAGIHTVGDLLFYLPRRYLDRSVIAPIAQLTSGAEVTILAQVIKIQLTKRPRTRLIVTVEDDSGTANCMLFEEHGRLAYTHWDRLAILAAGANTIV